LFILWGLRTTDATAQVGHPPLAEGDAPVMLAVAVATTLVTAWEIVTVFQRARRAQGEGSIFGASQRSA